MTRWVLAAIFTLGMSGCQKEADEGEACETTDDCADELVCEQNSDPAGAAGKTCEVEEEVFLPD